MYRGKNLMKYYSQNIFEIPKEDFIGKLKDLKPYGGTPLGPSVMLSVAMAAETKGGSTVVILTDGIANIGIGRFLNGNNDLSAKEMQESKDFYQEGGKFAKENQVKNNLISIISGEETKIKDL